ncbi:MAG: NAD(P)/FAD-dependent oxidoreductase [Chloroflexia bacterium]|nr:NAD(P)/FAD-dependent oxidoreductase [Chloroflexia bacterium]
MDDAPAETPRDRPRIVIVGAGISGLVLASKLTDVPADVLVLEQVIPPGRKSVFPGIVSAPDLRAIGLPPSLEGALSIARIAHIDPTETASEIMREPPEWLAIEHSHLLESLKTSITSKGVTVVPDATVTEFLWNQGNVNGVRCGGGQSYIADLVVLADESDPRLAGELGLRPDWKPSELMHAGKRKYAATGDEVRVRLGAGDTSCRVLSFRHDASWFSPGYGLVIPGPDSITLTVAMSLEDAMVSARHISEYLDEVERWPPVRECLDGLTLESFMTEVVPTGGFDTRNAFHIDHMLVVNDLVGVTNPLNRDGLSANLKVCAAAASTISHAVAIGDYGRRTLARYTRAIAEDVISPVDQARRSDRTLRVRPPWQWAAKAELVVSDAGVTTGPKSATLSRISDSSAWRGIREIGRLRGVRRHSPGERDG